MRDVVAEGDLWPVVAPKIGKTSGWLSDHLDLCTDDMLLGYRWKIVHVVSAYERLIELSGAARERVVKAIKKARQETNICG